MIKWPLLLVAVSVNFIFGPLNKAFSPQLLQELSISSIVHHYVSANRCNVNVAQCTRRGPLDWVLLMGEADCVNLKLTYFLYGTESFHSRVSEARGPTLLIMKWCHNVLFYISLTLCHAVISVLGVRPKMAMEDLSKEDEIPQPHICSAGYRVCSSLCWEKWGGVASAPESDLPSSNPSEEWPLTGQGVKAEMNCTLWATLTAPADLTASPFKIAAIFLCH